jgi:membrane-bound metal-dependent hydrolase YbcI (DUF457 family)
MVFSNIIALGFFLGYGLHLISDSFTKEGITPFYPFFSKVKSKGKISTGGKFEILVFVGFLILDISLFLGMLLK